jgi:hypothetical protein
VQGAVPFALVQADIAGRDYPLEALVGTCADLRKVAHGDTSWCSDLEPVALGFAWSDSPPGEVRVGATGDLTVTPMVVRQDIFEPAPMLYADLFVPASTPGADAVLATADRSILVTAGPGRDLLDKLTAAGIQVASGYGYEDYDFVAGLRAVVWTIAAVILAVGLLTFAIAAVDRALGRRREVVSLQLLGVSPSVLRRAQWLEAALPTGLGTLTAVAAGLFAGATYLQLGGDGTAPPWRQAALLAVAGLAASALVSALTVVATNSRLRPDVIRQE